MISVLNLLAHLGLIQKAQAAVGHPIGHPTQGSSLLTSLPMLLIFGFIFYFLLMRPQLKQQKQQKQLLSALAKGDEIVTTGGIVGTVQTVDDQFVTVLTPNKAALTLQKRAIAQSLPKGTLATSKKTKGSASTNTVAKQSSKT